MPNNVFGKISEQFSKITGKQKNIIALVGEVVLVAAIASVSIFGVLASSANQPSDTSSTPSSNSSSTTAKATTKATTTTTTGTNANTTASGSLTTTINRQTTSAPTTTGGVNSNGVLTWSDDQFLPGLNDPAGVLDYFITDGMSNEELLMFTTLQGIVNKTQPRIFSATVDPAEGYNTWESKLQLKFEKVEDPYSLIEKYKSEIKGIVVYDDTDAQTIQTINLATTMAGADGLLVVAPSKVQEIQDRFNFKNVVDLRDMHFQNRWDIYNYLYDNYIANNKTTNRVLVGIGPDTIWGCVRDYAVAIGAPVVYLDPMSGKDRQILDKIMSHMAPGESTYLGWWPQEQAGVRYASGFGAPTVASDYSTNLSLYSGYKTQITPQAEPEKLPLENKIYLSMIVSEGDNLQYNQGTMFNHWNEPARGQVPITWTMAPALYDVAKPLLNYYLSTATSNDCLVDGPSAYGYTYPNAWKDNNVFTAFIKRSNNYMKKIGLKTSTVWDADATMNADKLQIYADNMTNFLGITQQENNTPVQLVNGNFLSFQLTGPYQSLVADNQNIAKSRIQTYDGSKPIFITIQAVAWGPTGELNNFVDLANYCKMLDPNVEVIRLDQLMQLQTEYLQSQN